MSEGNSLMCLCTLELTSGPPNCVGGLCCEKNMTHNLTGRTYYMCNMLCELYLTISWSAPLAEPCSSDVLLCSSFYSSIIGLVLPDD